MTSSRKLSKWVDQGLITDAQRDAILDHEKSFSTTRLKYGMIFVALFSILLGISLIVAANWQDIAWPIKLGAHFVINAGLAALIWHWKDNENRALHREAALLGLWGLTLTLIALIGQLFQLNGTAYEALRLWFWITTPAILLFSRFAYTARIWVLAFALYVPYDIIATTHDMTENLNILITVTLCTIMFTPFDMWLIGSLLRRYTNKTALANALQKFMSIFAVIAASIASFVFYNGIDEPFSKLIPITALTIAVVYYGLVQKFWPFDRDRLREFQTIVLCGLFVTIPLMTPMTGDVFAFIHFLILWGLLAWIWQKDGQSKYVSFAVQVLTLRLFIGFLEVFDGLMASGFGFIIIGGLLLGLISGARKLNRYLTKESDNHA